jgi:hypothetical protein
MIFPFDLSAEAIDLFRLGVVYIHLIACCVAIGLVLVSDIAMVKQLVQGDTPAKHADLEDLQRIVAIALTALWVTGVAVVALDIALKGWNYLANPKLQAKILIVLILTLNGVVLHQRVLPLMKRAGTILKMSFSQSLLAIFAGCISGVSWFYAALLGVGRPLSWKYSLGTLVAAYPLLILAGFLSMLLITLWSKYRESGDYEAYQPTLQGDRVEAISYVRKG